MRRRRTTILTISAAVFALAVWLGGILHGERPTEETAADWFRERNLKVTIINFQKNDDAISAYDQGRCDAYTAGIGALAGQRIKFKDPNEHQILTEIISNDPQGPVTRWGDERWQLVVRWVLNGTIMAEALGVRRRGGTRDDDLHHGAGVRAVARDDGRGAVGAHIRRAGVVIIAGHAGRESCRGIVVEDQRLAGELREVDDHIGALGRR